MRTQMLAWWLWALCIRLEGCFSLKAGQDWVLRWGWETLFQGAVLPVGVSGLGAQPPLQNLKLSCFPSPFGWAGEQGFP